MDGLAIIAMICLIHLFIPLTSILCFVSQAVVPDTLHHMENSLEKEENALETHCPPMVERLASSPSPW
jgi:hypothetical protein